MDTKKQKGRKPSYRQMKAVEVWLRDGRRNMAKALRIAGYSPAVIRHPDRVFCSPVVLAFMRRAGIQESVVLPVIIDERDMRADTSQDANMRSVNVAEEMMKFMARIEQMSKEERRALSAALDAELERREKLEEKFAVPHPAYQQDDEVGYPHDGYKYSDNPNPFEMGNAIYPKNDMGRFSGM